MTTPDGAPAAGGRGRLYLQFSLGDDRYVIAGADVREVVPLRRIKSVPEEPEWLAGLIEHRGEVLPVVDLVRRATGRAAARRMATRIVLVEYGGPRAVGVLLERVSGTVVLRERDFRASPVAEGQSAYLGPVATVGGALVQRVEPRGLLPDDVMARLFPAAEAAR